MKPKYPDITVDLSNCDGNAFSILAACRKVARRAGVSDERIKQFTAKAKSGDYDHLLQTAMKWFDIE